jgi:hypothetical protein
MEWRRATRTIGLCHTHNCRAPIGAGDVYAVTRVTGNKRCETCARKVEPPPPTIIDDPPTFAPSTERQASLDIGARRRSQFVSISEARKRVEHHLRQRKRSRNT